MDRVEIEAKIREIVSGILRVPEDRIKNSDDLCSDLGADTIDMVEVSMVMEEEFGVEIPDEEAESIKTLQDLINVVADKSKV